MLTGSLQDAITAAKIGVHSTYNQFPFPLRIDYALFGGEIAALSYTDYNWNLSDHEPFKFMFKLNN